MGRKLNSDLVYQRIIDLKHGDCMKCCIATLFDLDYDEVPNFVDDLLWHENPNT